MGSDSTFLPTPSAFSLKFFEVDPEGQDHLSTGYECPGTLAAQVVEGRDHTSTGCGCTWYS